MNLKSNTNDEVYKRLTQLTKEKKRWEYAIPYVGNLLEEPSDKIREKAIWVIGEMGMKYPEKVAPFINVLAMYLNNENIKIRERAVGALGRIGRANHKFVLPYFDEIIALSNDSAANVRMNFI
ncbi:HEAT repeat domain-containing protein [Fusobacterium necrophorum]|uniref:HEAT repeat domain-containing protein n=1 Tax=Fusobacterium necrophorum TaxID=859 RepID=UPI00370DE941